MQSQVTAAGIGLSGVVRRLNFPGKSSMPKPPVRKRKWGFWNESEPTRSRRPAHPMQQEPAPSRPRPDACSYRPR